jgi:hypothetical protein
MCIAKVLHIGMSCPKKHICDEIIRLRLASHTIMLYVGHKIWSNKNRNEYYGFCVLRAPGQLSEADRKVIYMHCGAYQHSYTDPFNRTSPPIPIGPHWMVLWPFDATAAGLGTVMRDAGTMVMFAGTPYAHLHICGSPWDGNEYHPGDRVVRTLTYARTRKLA